MAALHILAVALPRFVRFGPWQLPSFGLIVTMGIVAALFVSQRTAPLAGLDPDRLWDAGIVAVLSAFAASRLLLIAMNPHTFMHQPLLVLAQPSLTVTGLAVASVAIWLWLRRHRLPLLRVTDAWAVPAVLLSAAVQLGHFAEGTELGMPTTLPWGVLPRGGHAIRLHPVQLYVAAAFLALAVFLLGRLRQQGSRFSGEIAVMACLAGGAIEFLFGFLRLPYNLAGTAWLDPGQWLGLAAMLTGTALWWLPKAPTQGIRLQEAH